MLFLGLKKRKQIWAIAEKKIKAKEKTRKRPCLLPKKNENKKEKKRTNNCPEAFGRMTWPGAMPTNASDVGMFLR